jgi:viroplasmin and RNaseH domain-containing protein
MKENIHNMSKEPTMITDWLDEHGDPEIYKKVEKKLESEEAAENAFDIFQNENPIVPDNHIWPFKLGYLKGAKWQQEKSYSEEDMIEFAKLHVQAALKAKIEAMEEHMNCGYSLDEIDSFTYNAYPLDKIL